MENIQEETIVRNNMIHIIAGLIVLILFSGGCGKKAVTYYEEPKPEAPKEEIKQESEVSAFVAEEPEEEQVVEEDGVLYNKNGILICKNGLEKTQSGYYLSFKVTNNTSDPISMFMHGAAKQKVMITDQYFSTTESSIEPFSTTEIGVDLEKEMLLGEEVTPEEAPAEVAAEETLSPGEDQSGGVSESGESTGASSSESVTEDSSESVTESTETGSSSKEDASGETASEESGSEETSSTEEAALAENTENVDDQINIDQIEVEFYGIVGGGEWSSGILAFSDEIKADITDAVHVVHEDDMIKITSSDVSGYRQSFYFYNKSNTDLTFTVSDYHLESENTPFPDYYVVNSRETTGIPVMGGCMAELEIDTSAMSWDGYQHKAGITLIVSEDTWGKPEGEHYELELPVILEAH